MTQTIIGLRVGDLIQLESGRKYQIDSMTDPIYHYRDLSWIVVYPTLCTDLSGIDPDTGDKFSLNEVMQVDDHWRFSGAATFVKIGHVCDCEQSGDYQPSLFSTPTAEPVIGQPKPYVFQAQCDYTAMDFQVWQCQSCKHDFNALTLPSSEGMLPGHLLGDHPDCPACHAEQEIYPIFVIQAAEPLSSYAISMHTRAIAQMVAVGAWSKTSNLFLGFTKPLCWQMQPKANRLAEVMFVPAYGDKHDWAYINYYQTINAFFNIVRTSADLSRYPSIAEARLVAYQQADIVIDRSQDNPNFPAENVMRQIEAQGGFKFVTAKYKIVFPKPSEIGDSKLLMIYPDGKREVVCAQMEQNWYTSCTDIYTTMELDAR